MSENNGNPVPSIDDLTLNNLIKFFENLMDPTSNEVGDSSTEDIKITRIKNGLLLSNEWSKDVIILQNGVETDKEQPNKDEIKSMQNFLLSKATEIDASILEAYLTKFKANVFS